MIYQPIGANEIEPELKLMIAQTLIKPLGGIKVSLVGMWLWVSGNTKPVKDELKNAGFRWSKNKEKWYFAAIPCASRGKWDYSRIAAKYGEVELA